MYFRVIFSEMGTLFLPIYGTNNTAQDYGSIAHGTIAK